LPASLGLGDNNIGMTNIGMTARRDLPEEEPIDAHVVPTINSPVVDTSATQCAPDDYPYEPRIQPMQLELPPAYEDKTIRIAFLRFQSPAPAQYRVPKRFGMSAILGIMTALALLFGAFRLLNFSPPVYLFFGVQTLVICFAQMLSGKMPRLASSIAGAILMPLFAIPLIAANSRRFGMDGFLIVLALVLIFGAPIGAFLGYLTGTCAAGIFLVMDYLEPYLQWQGRPPRSARA